MAFREPFGGRPQRPPIDFAAHSRRLARLRRALLPPPKRGSLLCDFKILSWISICFAIQKEFLL